MPGWSDVPLVIVETYSPIDCVLFGVMTWRLKDRGEPDPPVPGVSVDVFTTTYNEPIDLVITTAAAARRIDYPHRRPPGAPVRGRRTAVITQRVGVTAGSEILTPRVDCRGLPLSRFPPAGQPWRSRAGPDRDERRGWTEASRRGSR